LINRSMSDDTLYSACLTHPTRRQLFLLPFIYHDRVKVAVRYFLAWRDRCHVCLMESLFSSGFRPARMKLIYIILIILYLGQGSAAEVPAFRVLTDDRR
jgi:hypothetical protein